MLPMLKRFPPKYRTDRDLRDLQRDGLRWTVEHAWNNSPFYRKRLEEFGVTPDTLRSLADLARIPFTTAEDLRLGSPLPLRSVPPRDIVRIHSSSGTTGKRKILCYTQKDIDDWLDTFGRRYGVAGAPPPEESDPGRGADEPGDAPYDPGPAGRSGGLRHPRPDGAVRPRDRTLLPAERRDPLLVRLLHPRDSRPGHARPRRAGGDRRDGLYDAAQGGGSASPVPVARPDAAD